MSDIDIKDLANDEAMKVFDGIFDPIIKNIPAFRPGPVFDSETQAALDRMSISKGELCEGTYGLDIHNPPGFPSPNMEDSFIPIDLDTIFGI